MREALKTARLWSVRVAWGLTIIYIALIFWGSWFLGRDPKVFELLFDISILLTWPMVASWIVAWLLKTADR